MPEMPEQPIIRRVEVVRLPIPDEQKMVLFPLQNLLDTLEQYLTPSIREQIQAEFAAHLNGQQYPVLVANQLIDRVARNCLPDLSIPEAKQVLGRCYVARFQATFLGQLLPAVSGLNPKLLLEGLPYQYSSATNFGTYWIAELEPRRWRFDFEDDPGDPDWILGTLLGGRDMARLSYIQISSTVIARHHLSFGFSWS